MDYGLEVRRELERHTASKFRETEKGSRALHGRWQGQNWDFTKDVDEGVLAPQVTKADGTEAVRISTGSHIECFYLS